MIHKCSCGHRILDPVPIAIQRDRGVPLLILHNCPVCHSTNSIRWHMATDEQRAAADLAEMSRQSMCEMSVEG